MKVLKYKKSKNGKYIVYFDDGRSSVLYEDVILKYNLLLKKEINESLFKEINDINFEYDVYYVGLKSITSRFKSIYELRKFLFNNEDIDMVYFIGLQDVEEFRFRDYIDQQLKEKFNK